MSRRKKADKRVINPDPKYANLLVSKFMNYLMVDGKRTVASGIMYDALDTVKAKTKKEKPIIDILDEDTDDEFAAIAHPAQNKLNEAYNIDDALSQIPLERSDLFGEAAQSPVD